MQQTIDFGIKQFKLVHAIDSPIARVIKKENYRYTLIKEDGNEIIVEANPSRQAYIGDYLMYTELDTQIFLTKIYDRSSVISKATTRTSKSFHDPVNEQILAVNVDEVFILIAANQRFTLGKLERYILTFSQEAVKLTILLSKADFKEKADKIQQMIASVYPDIQVIPISIYEEETITCFKETITKNSTIVLIGASGAGKSSLMNVLNQNTNELTNTVQADGKGKHTTTVSVMTYLEDSQVYLIDTPGFKTIDSVEEVGGDLLFSDIQALSLNCKFSDCRHKSEPGCAVLQAINDGELTEEKLERFFVNEKKLAGYNRYQKAKQKTTKDKRPMKIK